IELVPGEVTVFRTVEELATGVRNGLITPKARIYHTASDKWLPIEFHPHYKQALELASGRGGESAGSKPSSVKPSERPKSEGLTFLNVPISPVTPTSLAAVPAPARVAPTSAPHVPSPTPAPESTASRDGTSDPPAVASPWARPQSDPPPRAASGPASLPWITAQAETLAHATVERVASAPEKPNPVESVSPYAPPVAQAAPVSVVVYEPEEESSAEASQADGLI